MYAMCFAMSHGKAKQWQQQLQHFDLQLVLQADNDFYSQTAQLDARGLSVTAESLAKLPPFLPCPEGKRRIHCCSICLLVVYASLTNIIICFVLLIMVLQ
jgi:hypothetical protein